jgi:hypothetical protein
MILQVADGDEIVKTGADKDTRLKCHIGAIYFNRIIRRDIITQVSKPIPQNYKAKHADGVGRRRQL